MQTQQQESNTFKRVKRILDSSDEDSPPLQ